MSVALDMACGNSKHTFLTTWDSRDRKHLNTALDKEYFFTSTAHANIVAWAGKFLFSSWTKIVKNDVTIDNHPTLYYTHPDYQECPWYDWGIFHFDAQPENKAYAGIILGFVSFETPDFHTPGLLKTHGVNVPAHARDTTIYVAVRYSSNYQNFDEQFVTRVNLDPNEHTMYILPLKDIVAPLARGPNMWNNFRDDQCRWLAILPYRKWGRIFGNSI